MIGLEHVNAGPARWAFAMSVALSACAEVGPVSMCDQATTPHSAFSGAERIGGPLYLVRYSSGEFGMPRQNSAVIFDCNAKEEIWILYGQEGNGALYADGQHVENFDLSEEYATFDQELRAEKPTALTRVVELAREYGFDVTVQPSAPSRCGCLDSGGNLL